MVEKENLDKYLKKENEFIEKIVKAFKQTYGKYWNLTIDFDEGEVNKSFTLKVRVYKRKKVET